MSKEKILIIEDEAPIREILEMVLRTNGFSNIKTASDGETGLSLAFSYKPDAILLDLMLPNIDGLGVCRKIRENPQTNGIPIIMLTAKSGESDIVLGLELGADDYITKPFSNNVLIARLRTQLRKKSEPEKPSDTISYKNLSIDRSRHSAVLDGKPVELTYTEFAILALLAKNAGRVFSRDALISGVRGEEYAVTDRAIDVQIVNLRRKLGSFGANIETVRGIGYKMKEA